MEVLYPRCAGLDVHAGSVTACARIASGTQVTYEHRTVSTTTRGLLDLAEWLTAHECTHVAMEATGVYWKPVWHVLEEYFALVLANAMHIRNVPGRKSDMNDATWIADLLAHGLIRSSFVPPAPIQELRDLTRTRRQLVHEVARHVLRLQKTLEDANLKLTQVMSDIVGVSGRAILRAHRGNRERHEPLPPGRASHFLGRLLPTARRKCRQTPLDAHAPERTLAQTHPGQCGVGRHAQDGQLSARTISAHQEPARREQSDPRGRQLHADRGLLHASRRR